MKKIMHLLYSSTYSGAENVAIQIITNLCEEYNFFYCSPFGTIKDKLDENNINYIPMKNFSLFELKKVLKKVKPDVVHAHDYKASILVSLSGYKGKIVSHIHNNYPEVKYWSLKSLMYLMASKKINKIVMVSKGVFEEAVFKKYIENKTKILTNCVSKCSIIDMSKKYEHKEKYDIVFFGRITEQKNPLKFINIVENLKKTNSNIKTIMIGNGPMFDDIKKIIGEKHLNNNIKMIGFISNPFPIIKKCDCVVMPSLYEGFGLTAIESMILDKPVFNSGVGGLKDIFHNHEDMICDSIEDYVNKIKLLEYDKYLKDIREIVENYTNIEEWKNEIIKIYE